MANYVQTIMDPMAGSPETPNAAKSAREWAALLTKNSQQPVHHWAQGIANMFNSALGGYTDYKANEAERMGQQKSVEQLLAALNPTATNTPIQQPQQPQLTPNAAPQDKFNWPNPPQTDPMFAGFGQNPESTAVPVPRGMRNNNPGNIIDSPFAKAMPGYIGSDGRFAKFASLDDGNAAMDRLLQSYGNRGLNTPEGIINRWAPPSDNNPTQAYAAKVARQLGVQPNATIDMNSPQVRQQLAQAITLQENGPRTQGLAPPAVPVSAAPPASAGVVPPGATPPIDRQALAQILTNPWASEGMKQFALQQLSPKDPEVVKLGKDDSAYAYNKRTGRMDLIAGNNNAANFEDTMKLRKEVDNLAEVKRYTQAAPIFQSMVKSAKNNSAAADLDFVYGIAKIFDPESVVREGEMKLVGAAQSIPQQIQGWMAQVVNGQGRLTPEQRQALLEVSQTRMQELKGALDQRLSPYEGIITRNRMNRSDVMPGLVELPTLPPPQVKNTAPQIPEPDASGVVRMKGPDGKEITIRRKN